MVRTENPDALILFNNSFAGRGEVPRREHPPGKVTVEIFAENHESAQAEAELKSAELTEITATLRPLNLIPVNISVPGQIGVSVYRGSMYVGEAPLTLRLPADQLAYLFAETTDGWNSRAVFLVNDPIPSVGSPMEPAKKSTLEGNNDLRLQTWIPPVPGQKRVASVRRHYYWSWGGTWITGIAAWLLYGFYTNYTNANNYGGNKMDEDVKRTGTAFYVSLGVVGVAVIVEAVQMARYIHTAGEDAVPVVKKRKAADGSK
jgi:hypothetical protein